MADIAAISESIKGLTLIEASELVKKLEEELGVSAAAAAVAVAPAAAAARRAEEAAAEQTEFTVVLTGLREAEDQGRSRRCAKSLAWDSRKRRISLTRPPKPVKEAVPKEEAEQVQRRSSPKSAPKSRSSKRAEPEPACLAERGLPARVRLRVDSALCGACT